MRKRAGKKQLSLREQARAIVGVAKMSFKTAPGAVLFKLAGAVIDAVLPLATVYYAALTTTALADAYAGNADAGDRVLFYVLMTTGLGLVMTVWRSLDQYVQAKMRYVVEARVSDMMYDHFLHLDFWQYDDKATADMYDKAQRFSQFFAYIFDRIASLLSHVITMVAAIIALVSVNGWLAVFILVAIVPGVYIQFKLSREQIDHWNQNIEARRSKSMIEWNLLQPKEIVELRIYGLVKHLMKLRAHFREVDEKKRIKFEGRYMLKRLLADALESFAQLGALVWVVFEIVAHRQPVGQFVYVQQVVQRAMNGASSFVNELSSMDEDIANLYDYQQFMELPERRGGTHALTEAPETIGLNNVSFKYYGDDRPLVLRDVSMTVKKHQHIAIVGENGAGKSTLIKLLLGLYKPTSGTITVDGKQLHDINIDSWHKLIGLLQQDFTRYSFAKVRENVTFGDVDKKPSDKNIYKALAEAEGEEFVRKLPQGLDSLTSNWLEDDEGNKGADISGGQWQRIALARNFYRDAPIIVLDEPTSAIDALAESRIFNRLFKKTDKTVITISHRVTTVKKADRIYMMENGSITEQGTHAELIAKRGAYYRMFESQLHESEKQ